MLTLVCEYDEDRGEYFSRPATEFDGCDPGYESPDDAEVDTTEKGRCNT